MPLKSPAQPCFGRMLVALHRSSADDGLLAYAAALARTDAVGEVHFVHVMPIPGPSAAQLESEPFIAEIREKVERLFADVPARVQRRFEIRYGPLFDQLLVHAAERQINVIMVGHRRDHPLRRSLARRLATKAPCSVWLVPEGSPATLSRILVPIDFSPRAADALFQSCALATQIGVEEIQALHVYFDTSRTTYDEAEAVVRGHEADAFRRFVEPIAACGVTIRPHFESGSHPAHTIVRVADELDADLIVMETRGRTASAAILLGSVAEETLIASHVPVLVVKHFGARLGVLQALLDRTFHRGPDLQFD